MCSGSSGDVGHTATRGARRSRGLPDAVDRCVLISGGRKAGASLFTLADLWHAVLASCMVGRASAAGRQHVPGNSRLRSAQRVAASPRAGLCTLAAASDSARIRGTKTWVTPRSYVQRPPRNMKMSAGAPAYQRSRIPQTAARLRPTLASPGRSGSALARQPHARRSSGAGASWSSTETTASAERSRGVAMLRHRRLVLGEVEWRSSLREQIRTRV